MSKEYKFEVVIFEGKDEFWEGIKNETGCDKVLDLIKDALAISGFSDYGANPNCSITLVEYKNTKE